MVGGNAQGGAGAADCSASRAVPPHDHLIAYDVVGNGGVATTGHPSFTVQGCPVAASELSAGQQPVAGFLQLISQMLKDGYLRTDALTPHSVVLRRVG